MSERNLKLRQKIMRQITGPVAAHYIITIKHGGRCMYEYDVRRIEQATGLLLQRRRKLIRYFSALSEPVRIGVHQLQTDLIRQLRGKVDLQLEEVIYASLLLALDKMYSVETVSSNRNASPDQAAKTNQIRAERIKADRRSQKRSPLKDTIHLRFYHLIKRLRDEEGLSWREITRYIKRYHGKEISHNYLRIVYENKRGVKFD